MIRLVCINLLLAVVVGSAQAQLYSFSPALIARVLEEHNSLRRKEGIEDLQWDDTSAQHAAETVELNPCGTLTHHPAQGFGENLAAISGGPTDDQAVKLVKMWEGENPGQKESNGTPLDGHITQMLWRQTSMVGCAMLQKSGCSTVMSCQYFPAGNMVGETYKSGSVPTGVRAPTKAANSPTDDGNYKYTTKSGGSPSPAPVQLPTTKSSPVSTLDQSPTTKSDPSPVSTPDQSPTVTDTSSNPISINAPTTTFKTPSKNTPTRKRRHGRTRRRIRYTTAGRKTRRARRRKHRHVKKCL